MSDCMNKILLILFLILWSFPIIGQNLIPFRKGVSWGHMDTSGSLVIKPTFDLAKPFEYNRAIVKLKDKYGYIDTTGRLVIPCIYNNAYDFIDDYSGILAYVTIEGKELCIDQNGYELPYKLQGARCGGSEVSIIDYGVFKTNNLYGILKMVEYIDNGSYKVRWDTIMAPKYTKLEKAVNGIFIAKNSDEKYGLISYKDSIISNFVYDQISFIDNMFLMTKDKKVGAMSNKGIVLAQPKYKALEKAGKDLLLAVLDNGKIGYIYKGKEYWEEK